MFFEIVLNKFKLANFLALLTKLLQIIFYNIIFNSNKMRKINLMSYSFKLKLHYNRIILLII